jgi:hypothetical protein
MKRQLVALALVMAATPLMAQWLSLPTPGIPRTADGEPDMSAPTPRGEDGRPDLTGLWLPQRAGGSVFDPANAQPWAQEIMVQHKDRYFQDDPRFRCLPSGPGILGLGGPTAGYRRVVQNPAAIAFLHADMSYRHVFLDGRELESDPLPTWMGYSVGRWDGDTLVIASNGYNDKTWVHRDGLPHTESLRVTERYTRLDFGHMRLDVTFEDPGTFDMPLHAEIDMEFQADNEMLETVCNEASEGDGRWGGALSDAARADVEVAPEVLAGYVGTYEGNWLRTVTTLEVTLEDGELFLLRTPPYAEAEFTGTGRSQLVPQSETAFECSCGLGFVFTVDDDGVATEVSEVHVSGEWIYSRAH